MKSTNVLRCVFAAILALFSISTTLAQDVITYYHTDATGSPVAATDAYGNVLWREDYSPYGERLRQDNSPRTNRMWFTGHHSDDDSGLSYAGARHYDPMVGRFVSTDPVAVSAESPFGFNRYAYANNNPYRYMDPNGMWALSVNVVFGAASLGIDGKSGQIFWALKGGLTGAGVTIDPSKNAPQVEGHGLPSECATCEVQSVSWEKGNIKVGLTVAAWTFQPFEYDTGTLVGEHMRKEDNYEFIEGTGWKIDLLNVESVLKFDSEGVKAGKGKAGVELDLEANYEKGGTVPWSVVREKLGMKQVAPDKSQ